MGYADGFFTDLQLQAAGGGKKGGGKKGTNPPDTKYGEPWVDPISGQIIYPEDPWESGAKKGLGKKVDAWIKGIREGVFTPKQIQNLVDEMSAQLGDLKPDQFNKIKNINRFLDYTKTIENPENPPGEDGEGGGYTPDPEATTGPQTVDEYLNNTGPTGAFKGMNENAIMGWALQDAMEGRKFAYEEFADSEEDFLNDPLVAQLNQSATDLLENPDVISDELQQSMLAGSDAILSRSYQGQSANLAGQIGGLNMDPNDPLAQSLAAQGRFGALQAQSQNRLGIQTKAATLNRKGLENAMRLGMGTAAFTQGTLNQFTVNKANLLAGQPLAGIGPEAAALKAAMNFDSDYDTGPDIVGGAIAGAGAGTAVMPGWGTIIGGGAGALAAYAQG